MQEYAQGQTATQPEGNERVARCYSYLIGATMLMKLLPCITEQPLAVHNEHK